MVLPFEDLSTFEINSTQRVLNDNIVDGEGIPTIDISPLLVPNCDAANITKAQISKACSEWGFFLVVNHGITLEVQERAQRIVKEFFTLTLEEKMKVAKDENNFLGYHNAENTKNIRDWKEIFEYEAKGSVNIPIRNVNGAYKVEKVKNRWPKFPPNMREACMEYAHAIEELAFKLLQAIVMTLGLPPMSLNECFNEDATSTIVFNRYPPCPYPDRVLGINPHTDIGAITILAQDDVGGLQVKRQSDGKWIRVNHVPNSFIINIGDLFQVWSNDRYKSTEHRVVVNSAKERFSIPFFFCPAHYTMVKPLDGIVSENNPSKYEEFEYGKYYKMRMDSSFQKQKTENVNVGQFRNSVI